MQDLLVIPASGSTCIIQSDAVDIQEKGGETWQEKAATVFCFLQYNIRGKAAPFSCLAKVSKVVVQVLASYNQML